jgi:hypothetical protein
MYTLLFTRMEREHYVELSVPFFLFICYVVLTPKVIISFVMHPGCKISLKLSKRRFYTQ